MVEVVYRNRLGNRLFQYCLGRIMSESLGFALKASALSGFPNTALLVAGKGYEQPVVTYQPREDVDLRAVLADRTPRKIVLHSLGQRFEYFRENAEKIRQWLHTPAQDFGREEGDLLLNFRLGPDYHKLRWILSPIFYEQVLATTSYERLFVSWDSRNCDEATARSHFKFLERFRPIYWHSTDVIENFAFIRSFSMIAIPASTFSWWAAFLSNAKKIFFPDLRESTTSVWREHGQSVKVRLEVDEPRYHYIKARTLWD